MQSKNNNINVESSTPLDAVFPQPYHATHLHQKLDEAIAIEHAAPPGAAAHVLESSGVRRRDGHKANVGFDRVTHEHDGAELPGRALFAEFSVNSQHCNLLHF